MFVEYINIESPHRAIFCAECISTFFRNQKSSYLCVSVSEMWYNFWSLSKMLQTTKSVESDEILNWSVEYKLI